MAPLCAAVFVVSLGGCGDKGKSAAGNTAPTSTPSASTPSTASTSPTTTTSSGASAAESYQSVRKCLDKAKLLTSEAVAQGASVKGIIVNPGGDIFFYDTPAAAAKDLPAIRQREGSSKPATVRGNAIFAYDKVLDTDGTAKRKIDACL
jgi:hypothetical protein